METTATLTRDTTITVTQQVLASMNSLLAFADNPKDTATPVLTGLRVTRSGDDQILVIATNRYVAVKATYSVMEFSSWSDAEFWIDPAMLKQAALMSKTANMAAVSFGYDTDGEDSFVGINDTRFTYRQFTAQFPPVERLFDDKGEPNGTPTVRLNVKWLALLSKVVVPEIRPSKDVPWTFSFFSEDGRKPMPVLATMTGSDYSINVLIQPNIVVR